MKVAATVFKENCLKLMSRVAKTHQPVVITKRGVPVAQLIAAQAAPESLFGYMQGTVTIKGDIVSPLQESWSVRDGDEDNLYTVKPVAKKRSPRKRK
jgi:prevent-host-death family protein